MSFAIQLTCSDATHEVVVDLERKLIYLPSHDAEFVRRYQALYELGGDPIPCCAMAIDLLSGLHPGYLQLHYDLFNLEVLTPTYCNWRDALSRAIDCVCYRVTIVSGLKSPTIIGRVGFYIGATRGQIIRNVKAFEDKGGKTIFYPPTLRCLVGEHWLIANRLVERALDDDFSPTDPDPAWHTATLAGGHYEPASHSSAVR